jgi:hypothetical protein
MAHFAKLGTNNEVLEIHVVADADTATQGGFEREDFGVVHLERTTGHVDWKKCSYNTREGVHLLGGTPFRANYPGIGWFYSSEHDIFHEPRPTDNDGNVCNSWILNTTTGKWEAPIEPPTTLTDEQLEAFIYYKWDESAYQADNTTGWILVTP